MREGAVYQTKAPDTGHISEDIQCAFTFCEQHVCILQDICCLSASSAISMELWQS